MSGNEMKKLNDKEAESVSGGVSGKKGKSQKSLDFGKCYCGYERDLRDISSKKMFMNAGKKKEWRCPQCGRNNVERAFKWEKIFEFK